jgi:hypothetical protein
VMVVHFYGEGSKDHFDVRITGRTAEGTKIEEDVFVSAR